MAKKKKKAKKKRTPVKLTPSRRARLILMTILQYAETGGMEPQDCGAVYEAVDNCLTSADDPEVFLSGLIDEIQAIIIAKEWKM